MPQTPACARRLRPCKRQISASNSSFKAVWSGHLFVWNVAADTSSPSRDARGSSRAPYVTVPQILQGETQKYTRLTRLHPHDHGISSVNGEIRSSLLRSIAHTPSRSNVSVRPSRRESEKLPVIGCKHPVIPFSPRLPWHARAEQGLQTSRDGRRRVAGSAFGRAA